MVNSEPRISTHSLSLRAIAIAAWGVLSVFLVLADAVWRLGVRAAEAFRYDPSPWALSCAGLWTALIVYGEGYRVFQLKFAPRVVARAFALGNAPRWHLVLAAPLYCMSLVHATPRGRAVAWITCAGIAACIAIIHHIPQPYRGLIDGGVAAALTWGTTSLCLSFARALATRSLPAIDTELPEQPP